jgi:membrane protein involved in colicin uptake
MSTEPITADAPPVDTPADAPPVDAAPAAEPDLGDAGKKALDATRAERNAARKEAAEVRAELDRMKAAAEGREAEWKADQDARKAADARYTERIVNAEVKAAATGKLSDPADALKFLDLSQFEIDDNGDIDGSAIESAIAALVESKPYLSAGATPRFQGTPDSGARDVALAGTQLSKSDLDSMTPEQINKARREGRLTGVL